MKKILLIAYYFPPIAATGAMRPLNFSRHLRAYGWVPNVLATDPSSALPPHPTDVKLMEAVPADIDVVRIPHANPRGRLLELKAQLRQLMNRGQWQGKGGDLGRERSSSPGEIGSGSWLLRAGKFLEERLLEFPDLQAPWFRRAIRALAQRSVQDRPQVIWATGRPWTGLLVGKWLARQWNVPFIADFRDPWVAGLQHHTSEYKGSSSVLWKKARALEASVCEAATRVVLNTEELRDQFCSTYPQYANKFFAITNGYPEELELFFAETRRAEQTAPQGRVRPGPVEIAHFGTVYGSRSPFALLQAVEQLMADGSIEQSQLRLRFVGAWDVQDPPCERLAKGLEEKGILKREPPIPHRQCLKEMATSDYLLILQAGFLLQIPAKIYEYIVSNRPLLVIGGEGATENLVHRHGLGRCSPNHVREIKKLIQLLLSTRSAVVTPDESRTAQFSYRVLTGKLAELLDAACREYQAGHSKS